jgi:glycerol-3-phosphate dehydrogenase
MTVLDLPGIGTVLNRCRPKTSGDIVVPYGGTAVLGTTDVEVDDPDDYPREEWETDLLVGELADVVPAVADAPVCHSYWGVRPLYDPPSTSASASPRSEGGPDADPTDVTRTHYVLDHADRDGVGGFTTVVGGKLTTHRLMAEDAADRVCARLGVDADAPTASVPLPGHDDPEAIEAALAAHGLASTAADRGIRPPAPE